MPAVAAELGPVRRALTEWAASTPLRPDQVEAFRLATYEAAANVVEHAYRRDRNGVLDLYTSYRPDQGAVTASVTDHGRWLPTLVDPHAPRGHGLPLINGLVDNARIATGPAGTTVSMTWRLGPDSPPGPAA